MAEDLNDKLPPGLAKPLDALDRAAGKAAASVDSGRVAARVLQRLQDEPKVIVLRPRPRVAGAMRIAAALALLVTGGLVARRLVDRQPAAATLPLTLDVASLDSAQRTALLDAVEQVRTGTTDSLAPATVLVEDLNAQELEQLLQTMDEETSL
jgi:hypothetical protein